MDLHIAGFVSAVSVNMSAHSVIRLLSALVLLSYGKFKFWRKENIFSYHLHRILIILRQFSFYSCQPTAPFLSPNYASTFSKWSARGRLISRSVVLTDNSTKIGTIAMKPPCWCMQSRSINLSFTTKYNVDYWESKFVHNNLYILY